MFTDFANFDWSNFFFQLVFCATAATIVSGAMAERTKFSTYCIYSAVISAIVYPIEAGWVWNSAGWLAKLGYVDFAGSSVIHMVGGIASVIGAAMLGPRIGLSLIHIYPGQDLADYVLGHFKDDEKELLAESLDKAEKAAELFAQDEFAEAMNKYSVGKRKSKTLE